RAVLPGPSSEGTRLAATSGKPDIGFATLDSADPALGRFASTMRDLDPRIQTYFWSIVQPANRRSGTWRLLRALDEAAGLVGCLPEELWILRGVYVLGRDAKTLATITTLAAALPNVNGAE